MTCLAWLLGLPWYACTPSDYLLSVGLSRLAIPVVASQVADEQNSGVVRMSKKFARRARLIREILGVLTAAGRFVKLILEILDKAANCDDRKLYPQIQVA